MPIVRKRCIVLVGKSGAGKSTIANQLVGHDPLSGAPPPFPVSRHVLLSETRKAEVKHEIVEFTQDGILYQVTIIDTVGLFNTRLSGQVILDQIKTRVTGNVILFVRGKGRFTAEEEGVFSLIRNSFKISPISALAVTGCENDLPEVRQAFLAEIRSDPKTREIASQMEKGIFPVGFPPVQEMEPVFQQAYKEGMAKDRKTLMDLAIRSDRIELTRKLFKEEVMPKVNIRYHLPIVRERCIVIMGKDHAGKSTIANQLAGHDPLSDASPPFKVSQEVLRSKTREVKHEMVEFTQGGIVYRVTIIDTRDFGLFDIDLLCGQYPILNEIEECFKTGINGINVILFVIKKGRFTAEEEAVFSWIRNRFKKEISPISALAVTGCENDSPEVRQAFLAEFRSDPKTREIASQMEKGIFPVGFPPLKTMAPVFQQAYKEGMAKDRKTLMDLVIRSDRIELTRKLFKEELMPKVKISLCTIQ